MQIRESGFSAQHDSGTCTKCGDSIEAGQEIANSGYGVGLSGIATCPSAQELSSSAASAETTGTSVKVHELPLAYPTPLRQVRRRSSLVKRDLTVGRMRG